MSPLPALTVGAAALQTSREIVDLLLPHRRAADAGPLPDRPEDFPEQLRQIAPFVERGAPVLFSLPGFPCKSPNSEKVLGHLPDLGERLALRFLGALCTAIGKVYPPGAKVLICSDGHIFGDVIGVPDEDIDAYGSELRRMIRAEGLAEHLHTFDLRDVYGPGLSYDEKRKAAAESLGPTVEELRSEVRTDEPTLRMYRGITKFLVEDMAGWEGSRSALQRDCRRRAYEVISRSRAWGALIAEYHPDNVRLSIHPQRRGEAKFGIRLGGADDVWATPWHSTVLRAADGSHRLLRRSEAEQLGRLVEEDGRPSHYVAGADRPSGAAALRPPEEAAR